MAKVFRIFGKSLRESETHWFNSDAIDHGIIDSIEVQETDGRKLPTSIPSPFAQIDLIRSAFTTVNHEFTQKKVDLDENKDAHRLVSNALDIGQIFFNYEKFKTNLSIDYWNKSNGISELKNSSSSKQQHLGKTLDMFLNGADAVNFNFDRLEKFFILKYKNQVIGGTSPKTLFFASADALNVVVDIECGNDKMLDSNPLALYKRDKDFIRYIYWLKALPNFADDFPEVSEYLDLTRDKVLNNLDLDFSKELRAIISPNGFKRLTLPNNDGIQLEILPDYPLYQSKPVTIEKSDFFINSTKTIKKPPMVLPVTRFNNKLLYTTEVWLPETEVPYNDNRKLEERTLPRVNDTYPYLTISDFLEDSIIKLPYKLDSSKYVALHGNENFLLPLKTTFFDYFTSEDLIKKDMISLTSRAGNAIEVKLTIPIQKSSSISYTKLYNLGTALNREYDFKYGTIIESNFTLGVYPFVSSEVEKINHTVAIAETNRNNHIDSITLIDSIDLSPLTIKERERSADEGLYSKHHLVSDYFDVIQVQSFGKTNVLIPKFKKYDSTTDIFEFAIDFGTTNTHIEYKHSTGQLPKAYNLAQDHFALARDENEELRGQALRSSDACENLLRQEIIDNSLGQDLYSFPFRSVILENKTINYNNPNYLYGDINIGFDYEKIDIRTYLTKRSNLKWLHFQDDFNNKRIEKFIQQLLELCKNKVLHNNGNLSNTSITWLYPTSMSYAHRTNFQEIWTEQFKEVFNNSNTRNIKSIPESIAPFYYYLRNEGLMNQTAPTVSIDIGGGTSDITVFNKNKPEVVSSVRFAGNSIFGDGYNSNINLNGFVKKYYSKYKAILENASENYNTFDEIKILNEIHNNYQSSDDLSNFLFSLEDNFNLKNQDLEIDYSKDLKNDSDFKIIFLVFFSSLIYHVAQIMKRKKLSLPENVLFSGTAAKTLNILDPNHNKIELLFNKIFNYVFEINNSKVNIKIDDSPKVLTAKGALMVPSEQHDLEPIIYSFLGNDSDGELEGDLTYKKLSEDVINSVILNINQFYNLLDSIDNEMSFYKSFGASQKSIDVFKEMREKNLTDYILTAIDERIKDVGNKEAVVDETLFFYPFTGVLNKLATLVVS